MARSIRDRVNTVLVSADNLRLDPDFAKLDGPRQQALELFVSRLKEINRSEDDLSQLQRREEK